MQAEINLKVTPALQSVLDERARQDAKWGEQNHNPYIYMAILMEELGELAQAVLETQFGGSHGGWLNVRKEAIHTAAVALAIIECLDRDKWTGFDVNLRSREDCPCCDGEGTNTIGDEITICHRCLGSGVVIRP